MAKLDITHFNQHEITKKIGTYGRKADYVKEINFLMKAYDIAAHRIQILNEAPDGGDWILIDDEWRGDLDDEWLHFCIKTERDPSDYRNESLENAFYLGQLS